MPDYEDDGTRLVGMWQDGKLLRDYITVNKGQQFRYDAALRNANNDLNPPFQILLLHTISSFFPGKFSWYYGFALNLAAFIVTQIYLYLFTKDITKNEFAAFGAILLYGFGVSGMNIAIYIRLYAVAVMFAVMFAYYSHRIYEKRNEKKLPIKELILLFIVCFLGAYTLHLFLALAFFITLIYSIYYLASKHFRMFFVHGFTCLISAGITLVLDPKTFEHFGGLDPSEQSYAEVSYPFTMQVRQYLYMLTKDVFGPHVLEFANVILESVAVFLGAIILFCIPIVFLLHKEPKFKEFVSKLKEKLKRIWEKRKNFQFVTVVLFVSMIIVVLFVAWRSSVYNMKEYSSRYIFVIYPLAAIWITSVLYYLIMLIGERQKVANIAVLVLCVIMAVWTHFNPKADAYFFKHTEEGLTFTQIEPGANVVINLSNDWLLVCFPPELYNIGKYFEAGFGNLKFDPELFKDIDRSVPCYLIADQTYILPDGVTYDDIKDTPQYEALKDMTYTEEDYIAYYLEMDEVKSIQYVGLDAAFGRKCKIYKIEFEQE
ncbi:MAG: hypothetical protein K5879_03710 [Lachnospiraceae bacterium]|nr:hypothetical protein [Lachnospiraceae bacterium]